MINLINIKTLKTGEGFDVYIGRYNKAGEFPESIWKNPYIIGVHGDREFCIEKYKLYLNTRPDLLRRLGDLKNKTLGCWCVPEKCHGEILIKLSESKYIRNWFSNMLPFDEPMIYQDIMFKTPENFYQAMKLPKHDIALRKEIADMLPFEAKKAIRDKSKYKWREDWSREKALKIMKYTLDFKFKKGTSWYNKLVMTENWEITEWNNWGDLYWGKDINTGKGENNLGKILMEIRSNYKND
jgi:predicted NAD-dependent protein-ADP-ribosyltransferase YbiA (DUF1768 family)